MRTAVKVCGLCEPSAAAAALEAGAALLGFHFCPSLRRITPEAARSIIEGLPSNRPTLVGVFIDQTPAEVSQIAEFCGLDLVQLHGAEAPGFDAGRPVMKALKVRDGQVPDPGQWPDPILLDTWSKDHRGGTGQAWNWERARPLIAGRRVFIAGGLGPGNVGRLVSGFRPHGVDVSSGVESQPGVKDPERIRAFVRAVQEAE